MLFTVVKALGAEIDTIPVLAKVMLLFPKELFPMLGDPLTFKSILPATLSFCAGVATPIPTLPPDKIVILVVELVAKFRF